jgi:hypothetical protein
MSMYLKLLSLIVVSAPWAAAAPSPASNQTEPAVCPEGRILFKTKSQIHRD